MKQNWLIAIIIGVLVVMMFVFSPQIKSVFNKKDFEVQKINEKTNYEELKKVEDTCRAMVSSYKTDKLTYEQYKDSDNKEKQGWGEQAKMRANKTANTYNEYILKNSFLWKDNVPNDIVMTLDIVE